MKRITGCSKAAICPLCGRKFPCGVSGRKDVCWCYYFPVVDDRSLKEQGLATCVCPVCLRHIALQQYYSEEHLPHIEFTETEWVIEL